MSYKKGENQPRSLQKTKIDKSSDVSINPWANLVIAMLSLNNYPLEKTWKIYDRLETNGLFNPLNFASWRHEELFDKLISSNYDRGAMTGIFVERLSTIAALVDDVTANEQILANGTRQEIVNLLTRIKGVGPVVLNNYMLLRGK